MKKKLKVLVLFDGTSPTTVDQDFSKEMKTKDWQTEANVMAALGALGHTAEHLAIFDDVDLLRQKLETFAPDVLFNLVEQFKNNPGFDQNIVSFFEMQGLPFTGCGSTGLTLCKHKGISKKILHYHGIHVPNFVVIPRGQRIGRPKQLKFPILVKPVKEEASYGISQASFVETDEQFRERVAFVHEKYASDAIAEEYIEGRELYVGLMGNVRLTVFPIRELVFREVPPNEPKIATYQGEVGRGISQTLGLREPVRRRARPGARRRTSRRRANASTACSRSTATRASILRLTRGQRGLFHRGEPKSHSRRGRGLRAFGRQGRLAVSAIDRPDHPARDEHGSRLIGDRLTAGRRAAR